jgi:hypothetical protein
MKPRVCSSKEYITCETSSITKLCRLSRNITTFSHIEDINEILHILYCCVGDKLAVLGYSSKWEEKKVKFYILPIGFHIYMNYNYQVGICVWLFRLFNHLFRILHNNNIHQTFNVHKYTYSACNYFYVHNYISQKVWHAHGHLSKVFKVDIIIIIISMIVNPSCLSFIKKPHLQIKLRGEGKFDMTENY